MARSPMHTPIFQAIVAINETVSASADTLEAVEVLAVVSQQIFNVLSLSAVVRSHGQKFAAIVKILSVSQAFE